MCSQKYKYVHLGIPYSKVGTDSINISIPILKLMEDFTIQDKLVAYTSDGGYNLKTCKDALLQTLQFIAHKKLCFEKIVSSMRYKVHARQPFWIESPRMTRAQFSCALQRSKKLLRLVLRGQRIVNLVQ